MSYGVSRVLQRCFDKEFSRGGLNETKEMSQKDRVLTASKTITIWMLMSHVMLKDISSRLIAEFGPLTVEARPTR